MESNNSFQNRNMLLQNPFVIKVLMSCSKENCSKGNARYEFNVFNYMNSLLNVVQRLDYAPTFLRRFPDSKFYINNGINHYEWVNYHYTNYAIALNSVFDISLLTINSVYSFGIKPMRCNKKSILKELPKDSKVRIIVNTLFQLISPYKEPRNLFVHRGRKLPLGFLDEIDLQDFLYNAEEELGIEHDIDIEENLLGHPRVRKYIFKMEKKNLIHEMKTLNIDISNELFNLFSELNPQFTLKVDF